LLTAVAFALVATNSLPLGNSPVEESAHDSDGIMPNVPIPVRTICPAFNGMGVIG
jgi:hypothetical protein